MLLSTAVLLAVPQSRTALAEIFGLEHVRVSEEPGPAGSLTPNVPRVESFAVQTTLANARGLVDFTLRFPTYPGDIAGPDAVYSQRFEDDVVIIATYEEARFDLYQSRLQGSFFKTAASVIRVTIGGGAGLWVPEGGHEASYLDVDEEEIAQSKRTVTRGTLLWEHDGVTYRLETELPRDEAIRVAESLR